MTLAVPFLTVLLVLLAAVRVQPRRARTLSPHARAGRRPIGRRPLFSHRGHRRTAPDPLAISDWCDDLTRHIRSGSTLHDALLTTPNDGPTARATDTLRLRLQRGSSVADAVTDPHTDPDRNLRLVLQVIAISARLGGSAAAAIDRTGAMLRQRAADHDERQIHAAQARLSAHVLTAVPIAMLGLLAALDDDVRAAIATPIGSMCVLFGLALNTVGWIWMRHIVRVPQ